MSIPDLAALPRRANRATLLGDGDRVLNTPEHLLALLLFFVDCPLDINCSGVELPILDGSALPYRDALARLFPERAAARAWRETPSRLDWEMTWPGGYLKVKPADRFSATCILSRASLEETVRLESADQAWREILPARTYIFHDEWLKGMQAGLLRGADMDSGLLLAGSPEEHAALRSLHPEWPASPYPLLNQGAWRMPSECARHKLLDLLGDLALAGPALPTLAVEIRNGGHAAHHHLLERLMGQMA